MYKSLYSMDDADFVSAITKEMDDAATTIYFSRLRNELIDNYAFYDGEQYDAEDIEALKKENKAHVVFNRVAVNIDVLAGYSILNPYDISPVPIDIGEIVIDEILEGAIRFIRRRANAIDAEASVFCDLLIGGYGVLHVYVDYSKGEPSIEFERVNPLEFMWDPSADQQNIKNAKWIRRERLFSCDTVEYLWPGAIDKYGLQEITYTSPSSDSLTPHSMGFSLGNTSEYGGSTGVIGQLGYSVKGIPIQEVQWWEYVELYRLTNPTNGQVMELTKKQYNSLKDQLQLDSYPSVLLKKKVYFKAFMSGKHLLERSENASSKGFTYIVATGKRRLSDGIFVGLVDSIKDPQKWANKFFSTILDILAGNTKGGAFHEEGVFTDKRKAEDDWAKANPLISVKRGGIDKIRDRAPHPYPAGIERLMSFAIEAIREVSGVNVEILGLADRRQAGVVEDSRKQSALAIIAKFTNSMTLLRQRQGYLIIEFMQNFLSPDQLIQIDSANGSRFDTVQAILDNDYEYQILVDEAPTSANYKERAWAGIIQILPILLRMQVPIPPEITDYAPIPAGLAQKWRQLVEQAQQVQQALAQQNQLAGPGESGQAPAKGAGPVAGTDINNLNAGNESNLLNGTY